MHHLFNANIIPVTINVQVGDSSLEGVYSCDYCLQSCAQRNRFRMFDSGSFCSPECAAANIAYSKERLDAKQVQKLHNLLQSQYRRRIFAAPPPHVLNSLKRNVWIYKCRELLTQEERIVADAELVVQKTN